MSTPGLALERGAERRWAISFALVAFLHVFPALVAIWWLGPVDIAMPPPASAVMIDMAPPPVPTPPAPSVPPRIEPPPAAPELPKAPKPAAAVPHHPPHPPVSRQEETPVPPLAAPQDQAAASLPAPAAPVRIPAAAPASAGDAAPTWRGLVLGRLEQFKRYPALARARRQQGTVYLRFSMNRDGEVVGARIEKSAGYSTLDEETLALLQRAQPLPKPPPEIGGETLELVVPIEYFLRERD